MCFTITPEAPKPKQRKAWKVVKFSMFAPGTLVSQYYTEKAWYPGRHSITANEREFTVSQNEACCGIYVYLDQKDAKACAFYENRFSPQKKYVVLEVNVHPRSFLHGGYIFTWHSPQAMPVATYASVVVPEEQPYITFYE